MKKYWLIGIIVPLLLLQACVTPQGRRQDYVDEYPDLSSDISASILKGEIAKGMNREDVKAAWGDPERETLSLTENEKQSQEIWSYYTPIGRFKEGIVILTFMDGKLINLVN